MSQSLNLDDDRFDDMFLQIVTQIGKGPQGLLAAAFGFLKRRTDFFYEAEPGDKMGFPPGYAESMVRRECEPRSTRSSSSTRRSTMRNSLTRKDSRKDGSSITRKWKRVPRLKLKARSCHPSQRRR